MTYHMDHPGIFFSVSLLFALIEITAWILVFRWYAERFFEEHTRLKNYIGIFTLLSFQSHDLSQTPRGVANEDAEEFMALRRVLVNGSSFALLIVAITMLTIFYCFTSESRIRFSKTDNPKEIPNVLIPLRGPCSLTHPCAESVASPSLDSKKPPVGDLYHLLERDDVTSPHILNW